MENFYNNNKIDCEVKFKTFEDYMRNNLKKAIFDCEYCGIGRVDNEFFRNHKFIETDRFLKKDYYKCLI